MSSCHALSLTFCAVLSFAVSSSIGQTPDLSFSHITAETTLKDGIEVHDGPMVLRITALRPDVIRLRAGRDGRLPEDASWAVLPEARAVSSPVTPDSSAAAVGFHTAALRVSVARATGLLAVSDLAGNVLHQDAAPLVFDAAGFHLAQRMAPDEHFFGLGDKTGAFDRREQAFRMWNTDAYAWQESTDPLYKDIPFFLSYRAGTTLGVLIDDTWPSSFDFGKTLGDTFQYRAEGGAPDIYLLYGPSAKQVLASYAWLTGPTPLPPLWALGFQQSRYSYMTQDRVLEVAARLRADHVPVDAIYLDIDYQQKNRPFTVNTTAFPDMAGMVKTLHDEHMHVVAITDLHIANLPNAGYAPYDSGAAGDHFVKNPDGSTYIGPVWPGPSSFPDFTRQSTRRWWGSLYKDFVGIGIDGFWNDMNEPSVFTSLKTIPNDVIHRIEEPGFLSRTATHKEIHNVFGMENTVATEEGVLALRPNVRPFVLTRASYAGGQRSAATWTGDNSATWNHLRLTTPMLKNLGLSGFSLAGADVGGYAGSPSADLLTKWMEIAAFQPIDRAHSEKGTADHEPWANGSAQENIRRRFIEERYRLLPYLYTAMESNTRTGLPLLRPLFLEFPNAAPDRHPLDVDVQNSGEFLLGPDLLIAAPPFPDKLDDYNATLPGPGWYDYWTGHPAVAPQSQIVAGGLQPEAGKGVTLPAVPVHPTLAALPVFVRPGAILPIAPLVQSTGETPQGPLTLRVFPGPDCHGELYQDDGTTFAFRQGDYLRVQFTCSVSAGGTNVHVSRHEGRFPAWWKQLRIEIDGQPTVAQTATAGRVPVAVRNVDGNAEITIPDDGRGIDLVIR